jgi:Family of unknown function (DUF6370)
MKTASKLLVGLSMALVVGFIARADDNKDTNDAKGTPKASANEVTLKGTITCAKCDLKLEKKCATVIKVKQDGKDVVYYFDPDSTKKYHKDICTEPKEGSVVGATADKDDKHWVKVSKIEYAK